MFKFTDWNKKDEAEEPRFKVEDYRISCAEFLEKRRNAVRPFVFDLRSAEDYEASHLNGAYSIPADNFENAVYQMPYEGDILLYGGGQGEAQQAAEQLYDNGFDTFYFIETLDEMWEFLCQSKFTITDAACAKIKELLSDSAVELFQIIAAPISAKKAQFSHGLLQAGEEHPQGKSIQVGDLEVFVDLDSLLFLSGTSVDYGTREGQEEAGFIVKNPDFEVAQISGSDEREIMEKLLEEEINPMVAGHGGFITLIDIKDNRVYLEFGGGCKGCGMIDVTLKQGVEVMVKENLPSILEILDVTDHANGTNPYYQPGK